MICQKKLLPVDDHFLLLSDSKTCAFTTTFTVIHTCSLTHSFGATSSFFNLNQKLGHWSYVSWPGTHWHVNQLIHSRPVTSVRPSERRRKEGGVEGCENISTNKRDRDKESTLTQSLQQRHQDKIKQQDSAPHCTWEEQEVTQTPWTTAAAAAGLPPGFRHAGGETPEIPDPDRHFSN